MRLKFGGEAFWDWIAMRRKVQGGVAAVPQILARRLQTRYRFDENASIIEALEIQNVYDPQATGFADLNGAQPVAVIKSRLTLERR